MVAVETLLAANRPYLIEINSQCVPFALATIKFGNLATELSRSIRAAALAKCAYLSRISIASSNFSAMESSNLKMAELSIAEKFEEAIDIRDKYAHLARAAARIERLNSVAKLPTLIVAKANGTHWEFISIKYGRLAASNVSTATTSVSDALSALELISEQVPNSGFLQQVNYEEVELILNFLESPGVRMVKVEGEYGFATFGPNSQLARIGNYDFTNA